MKFLVYLVVLFSIPQFCTAQATQPASAPTNARVLIISVDGLRPDLLLRAQTPTMHHLLDEGSFTFWARTTAVSITLPSHTSMLTGVTPAKHGILWNSDLPLTHPIYPAYPTIFQVAKKAGYTTAMAAGKAKFSTLARPGSLDWQYIAAKSTSRDEEVTDQAIRILREHQPEVMFIHLPNVDNVGHAIGWGTHEQLAAIAGADQCIGRALATLDDLKLLQQTFIIVTADHGGAGRSHGADDPRSRHIPWIAVGPGVRRNFDLTTESDLTVNTEDTFATACYVLKIRRGPTLDGKPVTAIFEHSELIGDPK